MTIPRQHVVFHRADMTITVHDGDPASPGRTIAFTSDLDAALAGAALVRVGAWQRRDGGALLVTDAEPATA